MVFVNDSGPLNSKDSIFYSPRLRRFMECVASAQVVGNHSIDMDTASLLMSTLGSVLRRRLSDEVHAMTGSSRRLQASWGDLNSLLDAMNSVATSFGLSNVHGESQDINEPNVDGVVIQTQVW